MCIKKLKRNIGIHLDDAEIDYNIGGNWDRIVLEVSDLEDNERIIRILSRISGLGYFTPVSEIEVAENLTQDEIFDSLASYALAKFSASLEWKSFVVRVKRSGTHTFNSITAERQIGGRILAGANNAKVNIDYPDINIHFDIKNDKYYLLEEKYQWLWGYPVWFQGKVLSLVSGGFDSGVSTFSLMKRGCEIDYLFFNLWGTAHELWVQQVSHFLWQQFSVSYKRARFISIPFEEIVTELLTKVDHSYRWIVLKRCMLQVASTIAERHYEAIIKWDSLGQVSSQTLRNMSVIDEAARVLTLRPLISMNKQDIVDTAKKIGTYDFAKSMPEYCGVISDKPSVWASREEIVEAESNFDMSLLDRALDNRTVIKMSDILHIEKPWSIAEVQKLQKGEIAIDIREPERVTRSPLSQKWIEGALEIPFYEINQKFKDLDQTKSYAFYCDKWVLSHLHGLYLGEKGFENISVLRPS